DLGVLWIELHRDQASAGAHASSQPDRGVAGQRSELEDRPRIDNPRQQLQEFSLVRRDGNRRQSSFLRCCSRGFQDRILWQKLVGEVLINVRPKIFSHYSISERDSWVHGIGRSARASMMDQSSGI